MSKKILSLLLVLTLLVTVSVFAVEATEIPDSQKTYAWAVEQAGGEKETLNFYCEHCGELRDWTKYDASETVSNTLAPKITTAPDVNIHVYVPTGEHTMGSHKIIYQSVCMYLAGNLNNDATNTTKNNYYMFRLYSDATFTERFDIVFSVMGTGTLKTHGNEASVASCNGVIINQASHKGSTLGSVEEVNIYPGVTLDATNVTTTTTSYGTALSATYSYCTFNMYGGTVKGGSAPYGGTVYLSAKAEFNMYGGEIIGGTATNSSHGGGAVCMITGATFNMYKGATITGGNATACTNGGGAIYMNSSSSGNSTFNMYGGTITGGTCKDGYNGGAVGIRASAGTTYFNMYGGTITGGADTNAGAVRVGSDAVFTVNDAASVTLPEGAQKDAAAIINGTTSTYGGAVEVKGGSFTLTSGTIDGGSAQYGGAVAVLDGSFELGGGKIINGVATGTSFDNSAHTGAGGGNVYVMGENASFEMTGGTIGGYAQDGTSNGGRSAYYGANVLVTGSGSFTMSGGKIEAGFCTGSNTNSRGANVAVTYGASFTMSGTADISNVITSEDVTVSNSKSAWAGANVYVANESAQFTMNGGSINGGTANRGSVTTSNGGTFEMTAGTINGGRCTTGGAIHNEGVANLSGGTINGGTAENGAAIYAARNTVTMSGTTVVNGGTADNGGAVSVSISGITSGYAGTFNMQGGTINGGTATNGAAVYLKAANYTTKFSDGNKAIKSVTAQEPVFNHTGGTINAGTAENPGSATTGGAVYLLPANENITVCATNAADDEGTRSLYTAQATYNLNGAAAVINGTNCTVSNGAAVAVLGGQFVMTNGTINGGTASTRGGSVYVTRNTASPYVRGSFTMEDGKITGGKSATGGNISLVTNSEFIMNGGEISLGYATGNGGNVHVYNLSTFTMNGGKVILGSAAANGGNFLLTGSTGSASYAGKLILNNGVVAAGAAGFNGNGRFGGNVAVLTNGDLEMHGGVMTRFYEAETAYTLRSDLDVDKSSYTITVDSENANKYWGAAYKGDNIAVWSEQMTDVIVDGGTVDGGRGDGAVVYVGSYNDGNAVPQGWNISIGNVSIGDSEKDNDIFFDCRETEGWQNIGKLTVANGFADKMIIDFSRYHTDYEEDGITINKVMAVAAADYTNTGSLIYLGNDKKQVPIVASAETETVNEVTFKPLVLAPVAIYDGKNVVSIPATAQAAVETELGAKQYVKLFNSPDAVLSLTRDTIVDFNGNDATVTLNGFNLTGMDAQTDDYTAEGAANVTIVGEQKLNNIVDLTIDNVPGQRKYLYLDGGFHRYYLTIDKAGLRAADNNGNEKNPGVMYSGSFRGDEVVLANMDEYGVQFVNESNQYSYGKAPKTTAKTDGGLLAIHGWLPGNGEIEVPAQAYIKVDGETIYSTHTVSKSLRTLTEDFVTDYNEGKLADAFCSALEKIIDACKDLMAGWNIELSKPEVPEVEA